MSWRRALSHRHLLALLLLGLAGLAALQLRSELGLEWSTESVRSLVESYGLWGPTVFVLLFNVRLALFLPSKLLLIAAGVCFGAIQGTLWGALGIALSGVVAFGLTRWLGLEVLRSQVPPRARRALERAGGRGGAGLMGLATGYPIGPLTVYHVGAALTAMPFVTFGVALLAGSLVRAAIYCTFGNLLVTGGPVQIVVAAGLLALAALPLLHPRLRIWLQAQLGPDLPAPAPAEPPRAPESIR